MRDFEAHTGARALQRVVKFQQQMRELAAHTKSTGRQKTEAHAMKQSMEQAEARAFQKEEARIELMALEAHASERFQAE